MSDMHMEDMDAAILARMREDFLDEAEELTDKLNLQLTQLEKKPGSQELVNEIFRIVHTLKSSAAFVGMDQTKEIAHKMEDVFGALREGTIPASTPLIDVMFEGLEILRRLKSGAMAGAPENIDTGAVLTALDRLWGPAAGDANRPGNLPSAASPVPETTGEDPPDSQVQTPDTPSLQPSQTVRVRTDRLDSLMNLIGELIIARNRLNNYAQRQESEELEAVSSAIDRLTGHLQEAMTGIRMVPIEWLFNKFPGMVRNMAREQGKHVVLSMTGKETELDKSVIDRMYNPLMHLIRNAVDHGIETPEERTACGKDPLALIGLTARHQKDHIVIEVADDGRGLQSAKIVRAAVQKGVLPEEEALQIDEGRLADLIFTPGLTTSKTVSDVSGRGVGMDAVRNQIRQLRGTVKVRSSPGRGTAFRLRLPLTLSVLQVLLVKTNGLCWGIALSSVLETLYIAASDIQTIEKQEVVFIRDTPHPLKRLATVLHLDPGREPRPSRKGAAAPVERLSIVIVQQSGTRTAIWVDELLGKHEVVIKSLGDFTGHVPGIEGATILADGTITPIINVENLVRTE